MNHSGDPAAEPAIEGAKPHMMRVFDDPFLRCPFWDVLSTAIAWWIPYAAISAVMYLQLAASQPQ